jgi:hypothetical protein
VANCGSSNEYGHVRNTAIIKYSSNGNMCLTSSILARSPMPCNCYEDFIVSKLTSQLLPTEPSCTMEVCRVHGSKAPYIIKFDGIFYVW